MDDSDLSFTVWITNHSKNFCQSVQIEQQERKRVKRKKGSCKALYMTCNCNKQKGKSFIVKT